MNKTLKKITRIISFLLLGAILFSCETKKVIKREFSFSELKELAELATLECHFNNIATISKNSTIIPGFNLFMDNSRKVIVEYQGIAKIGVDMGNVKYDEDTKTLTIPMATVLSVVDDPNTYDIIANNEGFFKNKINDEEIRPEIVSSLKKMKTNLLSNKILLRKAQSIARVQIEELVDSLFTMGGKKPNINYELE